MNKTYRWGIDPDTEQLVIEDRGALRSAAYYTFSVRKHFLTGLCFFDQVDGNVGNAPGVHFVETEDAPNPKVVFNIIEAARKAKAERIAQLVKTV